jgi:hypothetical protein
MHLRSVVLAGLASAVWLASSLAQPGGVVDTVRYRTKEGGEKSSLGELKETAAGLVLTANGKTVATIPPQDVIAVYYGRLDGVDDKDRLEMPTWDSKGGPDAKKNYEAVLKKIGGGTANERTKRFLEFKVAMWTARNADAKSGDEFKTEAAAAVDKLTTVARSYKSWEVWPAARTAARLQAELGEFDKAAATLTTLAKLDGLPADLKGEARLAEVDVLLRSGNASNAATAVGNLTKDMAGLTAGQKDRVAIYQAAVKGAQDRADPAKVAAAAKAIRELADKSTDPAAKASAHNVMGELFFISKMPRDAMWEYLWVEAVYNHDRDEVVKALTRLAELFDAQGEKERAAVYREKLQKAKAG